MAMHEATKRARAQRILRVARQLFVERGVAECGMEEIAAAAGISRASLFNYYPGKSALLNTLAAAMEPRLVQMVEHYRDLPQTTAQRLLGLFAHSARVLEKTAELNRALFVHDRSGLDYNDLMGALGSLLQEGQRQGDVDRDLDLRLATELVYLSFIAGVLGWLRNPEQDLKGQFAARARHLALLLAPAHTSRFATANALS